MTATAPLTAPSIEELAPHVTARVKPGDLATAQNALLGIGAGLIGLSWALGHSSGHFYWSYLIGYMGVLGISLCGLFFTMVQHITRAGWSVVVRRLAENIAGTLPMMLLLFLPVLIGFGELYHHWLHPKPEDTVIAGKASYLNSTFFFVRVALYFAIWISLAWLFRSASLKQDASGDPAITLRLSRLAAPGLLLFALSVTFAAFDWIMSLDPHWFSTIFGLTYFAGGYMAFFAFTILLAKWLGSKGYLKDVITVEHYHDLGKLLFAFMVFWTYTNFSQYMLIWYANLPEETQWYDVRQHGGWGALGTILIVGHFLFPFVFLMSRHIKRNGVLLSAGAIFLLVIHCLDMQYLILPSMSHGEAEAAASSEVQGFGAQLGEYLHHISWMDFACFLGVLAVLAGLTIRNIRQTPLVPMRDPRLAESLHFTNI